MSAPQDKIFVRERAACQLLCPARDKICVRTALKSFNVGATLDNIYVRHQVLVSDIKFVISDTKVGTIGHKVCHRNAWAKSCPRDSP